MVVTGISSPAFMIAGMGKSWTWRWSGHDCTLVDPYDPEEQPMKFTNAIGSMGKFYALSLHGTLAFIEEVDSEFRITCIGKNRVLPSVPSRHFKEYLTESDGVILLIFLICRKSIHNVDDVEVFRLDFSRLSWLKMESIGDRTLFLVTNCCMSVGASKVGCKSNRVYFTRRVDDEWQKFDMASGSISPSYNTMGSKMKFPAWDEPVAE
ncbi:hypothetical protein ACH5RR_006502 [Cinchona calisaya]|uniref:KIB1-4 beta-propeller domain-containing protein n=1 Tax=Cinchona calisaya TaxID=153742 RepID=A0ABD3AP65_9GENT